MTRRLMRAIFWLADRDREDIFSVRYFVSIISHPIAS